MSRILKYYLIIIFGLFSFSAIGQKRMDLSGKVIDFKTGESIIGVAIKSFKSVKLNSTDFSIENGEIKVLLTEETNRLEFHFIGYLPLIIENINYDTHGGILLNEIQLYEDPFGFVSYETKPSRKETKERRREQKKVKRGLKVICDNGIEYKMRFSKKNNKFALYIDFKDLIECSKGEK
jgi:hypothetical protein